MNAAPTLYLLIRTSGHKLSRITTLNFEPDDEPSILSSAIHKLLNCLLLPGTSNSKSVSMVALSFKDLLTSVNLLKSLRKVGIKSSGLNGVCKVINSLDFSSNTSVNSGILMRDLMVRFVFVLNFISKNLSCFLRIV